MQVYQDKSFSAHLQELIANIADYSKADVEISIPFWYRLIAVGSYRNTSPDGGCVQNCVKEFCNYAMEMILTDEDYAEEYGRTDNSERVEAFVEGVEELLTNEEVQQTIKSERRRMIYASISENFGTSVWFNG